MTRGPAGLRALTAVTLAVVTACAPAPAEVEPLPPTPVAPATTAPVPGPLPLPSRTAVSPVRLVIPAIGFDRTGLIPLAIGEAGELLAPDRYSDVGWYSGGPAPGDPGPAVIAAHVDSRSGPAPFFRLRELRPGDEIRVSRSDGADVTFWVDAVQNHPKDAFPTQAVYGPTPGSALRLITCGGSFDATEQSYRDNVVVFASQRWA